MSSLLFERLSSALLSTDTPSEAQAAVMVLLTQGDTPSLVYTKRALHLRSHPGEICFPGGRREAGDAHLLATALRETEEEIGLPGGEVRVLGCLPEFRTRAGIQVLPFVGVITGNYPFIACPVELHSIFQLPLACFNEEAITLRVDTFERDNVIYRVPVYHYLGHEIWGLTAAITASLLQRLNTIHP